MPQVQLGMPVVFRPGTAFEERWGPGQILSGMITSIQGNEASLIILPAGEYPPFYEIRVARDDALSKPRTWTPSIGENQGIPEAPVDGRMYGRRNQAWAPVADPSIVPSIIISDTIPIQPMPGMAWLDTTLNNFFIYTRDNVWVEPCHVNPT